MSYHQVVQVHRRQRQVLLADEDDLAGRRIVGRAGNVGQIDQTLGRPGRGRHLRRPAPPATFTTRMVDTSVEGHIYSDFTPGVITSI